MKNESFGSSNQRINDKYLAERIALLSNRERTDEAGHNRLAKPRSLTGKVFGFVTGRTKEAKKKSKDAGLRAEYLEDQMQVIDSVRKEVIGLTQDQIRNLMAQAQNNFYTINKEFLELKKKLDLAYPSNDKLRQEFTELEKRRNLAFFRADQFNAIVVQN